MDTTTFEIANKLNDQIKELNGVLDCFGWQPYCDEERADIRLSTNPQLIIEFDVPDGRDQIKVPSVLNEIFIDLLRTELKVKLDQAKKEFNAL